MLEFCLLLQGMCIMGMVLSLPLRPVRLRFDGYRLM